MSQLSFSTRLLQWFDIHGRHTLPWQQDKNLYRVWVSEIMLQQTQVSTVINYYERFMHRFPDLNTLALASVDDVLHFWAGLGYYARGRNLHVAANIIVKEHNGKFPEKFKDVLALPGIGRSTAGAILALTLGQRHAILDGNVKRILCRYHHISDDPSASKTQKKLWLLAQQLTPQKRVFDYTQAIMDLGATVCKRSNPNCQNCPHQKSCQAHLLNVTHLIPQRKTRKPRSHRHIYFLTLMDQENNVLIFKRPSQGIWGGLYSLPEFATKTKALNAISTIKTYKIGRDIHHAFTHYTLQLTPVYAILSKNQLKDIIAKLSINNSLCVNINQFTKLKLTNINNPNVGIPAPILKILQATLSHDKTETNLALTR